MRLLLPDTNHKKSTPGIVYPVCRCLILLQQSEECGDHIRLSLCHFLQVGI